MITPLYTKFDLYQSKEITNLIKYLTGSQEEKIKLAFNTPSGDFFYDPWIIKNEYKETIFEKIISSLSSPVGEARIIILKPGSCYHSHADIDDRYHLNLQGQYSYLIDLDHNIMYETNADGMWYTMNTSRRHVAANFGSIDRIQIVVRHLLSRNNLNNPITVNLFSTCDKIKSRFVFDDQISPWLNFACKRKILTNFKTDWGTNINVSFDLESSCIDEFSSIIPPGFNFNTI